MLNEMTATIPMPIVWHVRIAGNAHTVGASRIHVLSAVDSEPDEERIHVRGILT